MPTSEDIIKTIAEHLGLNPEDIDISSSLRDELNLGPIELNDLLSDLSQKYSITFEPHEVGHLQKVGDLLTLVEDNLLD